MIPQTHWSDVCVTLFHVCGLEKVNKWKGMKCVLFESTMYLNSFLHCSLGAVWNGTCCFFDSLLWCTTNLGPPCMSDIMYFEMLLVATFHQCVAKEKRRKTEKLEQQQAPQEAAQPPQPSQSQPPEPAAQCSTSNWDGHRIGSGRVGRLVPNSSRYKVSWN